MAAVVAVVQAGEARRVDRGPQADTTGRGDFDISGELWCLLTGVLSVRVRSHQAIEATPATGQRYISHCVWRVLNELSTTHVRKIF